MNNALIDRIRIKIGAMGSDEFERFMSTLLPSIYPGFDRLEPSFNFIGKTTTGKCDAHVYHASDDTYTAIICTTQQTDISRKIIEDIGKLPSTKFASKIRRVLICVNTPLKDEVEDYRSVCAALGWELDPLSLERITKHTAGNSSLLLNYFGESTSSDSPAPRAIRHFDCGHRIKEAREDASIPVSRIIEHLHFPSERAWKAIESGEVEIAERDIDSLSALTGISTAWLKHGAGKKYPTESIYDYQVEKIVAIAAESPLASYMAIEPDSMDLALISQFSEFRWKVYAFGFNMDFWNWQGDHHHVPLIYELLETVNDRLGHPYGRIIKPALMNELRGGDIHPFILFQKTGSNNYWFEDLFDLNHNYPVAKDKYRHYGEWFVKLQDEFRNNTNTAD